MKTKYLEFWDQKGNTYYSKDAKYEAIKAKDGTYKVWKSDSDNVVGVFYNDDILNDHLGYVKTGASSVSVGAKGYGDFKI